jgi:hypothetical protein
VLAVVIELPNGVFITTTPRAVAAGYRHCRRRFRRGRPP